MKLARKKSRRPKGDLYALVFNGLLVLLAFLGAHGLATAFNTASPDSRLTTEILADTRQIIDRSLSELSDGATDKRTNWADRVKRELIEQDLSAARGFLLAAPSMLSPNDVRSLEAAAESEPYGSADQRLVRAALLFLPNDVRRQYEALIDPPELRLPVSDDTSTTEDAAAGPGEVPSDVALTSGTDSVVAEPETPAIERNPAFSVLGTEADLVTNSQRWIAEDPVDIFVLRLAGLAHLAESGEIDLDKDTRAAQIAQAASILKSAKRASRLEDVYLESIGEKLEAAMPENELAARLNETLDVIAPRGELIAPVKAAFRDTIKPEALPALFADFEMISDIATDTSPTGAMFLLEHATGRQDVLRARRIARAGSDRAVALVKEIGPDAIVLFENHVKWSNGLVILIMVLAGGGMALLWTTFATVSGAFQNNPVIAISRYRREH